MGLGCSGYWESGNRGPRGQAQGVAQDELPLPIAPLVAGFQGTLRGTKGEAMAWVCSPGESALGPTS